MITSSAIFQMKAIFFLHGLPRSGFLSTNCLDSLLIIDTQVLLCSVVTQFFEMSTIST